MKVVTDFLTGKPNSKSWSGVHGYRPENGAKVGVYGEMFGVLTIGSEIEFDFANMGGLLFDELQERYFEPYKTETNFDHFKKSVYGFKDRLDEILSREPDLAEAGIDLELAIAVVKSDVLYIAVVGESHVYIKRGEELADIAENLIDSDQEGFMRTGSILLTEGDKLMLATSNAKELSVGGKFEEVLDNFNYARDNLMVGASILLGYGVEPPEKPEAVVEILDQDEDGEEPEPEPEPETPTEEIDLESEVIKAYEENIPEKEEIELAEDESLEQEDNHDEAEEEDVIEEAVEEILEEKADLKQEMVLPKRKP